MKNQNAADLVEYAYSKAFIFTNKETQCKTVFLEKVCLGFCYILHVIQS